jgi:hypothetical protein
MEIREVMDLLPMGESVLRKEAFEWADGLGDDVRAALDGPEKPCFALGLAIGIGLVEDAIRVTHGILKYAADPPPINGKDLFDKAMYIAQEAFETRNLPVPVEEVDELGEQAFQKAYDMIKTLEARGRAKDVDPPTTVEGALELIATGASLSSSSELVQASGYLAKLVMFATALHPALKDRISEVVGNMAACSTHAVKCTIRAIAIRTAYANCDANAWKYLPDASKGVHRVLFELLPRERVLEMWDKISAAESQR